MLVCVHVRTTRSNIKGYLRVRSRERWSRLSIYTYKQLTDYSENWDAGCKTSFKLALHIPTPWQSLRQCSTGHARSVSISTLQGLLTGCINWKKKKKEVAEVNSSRAKYQEIVLQKHNPQESTGTPHDRAKQQWLKGAWSGQPSRQLSPATCSSHVSKQAYCKGDRSWSHFPALTSIIWVTVPSREVVVRVENTSNPIKAAQELSCHPKNAEVGWHFLRHSQAQAPASQSGCCDPPTGLQLPLYQQVLVQVELGTCLEGFFTPALQAFCLPI